MVIGSLIDDNHAWDGCGGGVQFAAEHDGLQGIWKIGRHLTAFTRASHHCPRG